MEIELKYLVDSEDTANRIFSDEYICSIKDADTEETLDMQAVYFDTEDRRLFREGIAFRVRKEGEIIQATLKWNGSSEDGMHVREEINVPVDDESKLVTPDVKLFELSEMSEVLEELVGERRLEPLVNMNYTRRQVRLDTGSSISELSVDLGEILCNGQFARISELEIELFSGSEDDMKDLGEKIAAKYGLKSENTSKLKRGLALL